MRDAAAAAPRPPARRSPRHTRCSGITRLRPSSPSRACIDDGVLLGTAVARYARTWPPQAGSASASITIAPPDGLVERSRQPLTEIGWRGVFELEFLELADGRHAAIDLNPRVYGSMSLAIAAGANLPAVWVDVLRGTSPRPVVARPGVHYRWEEGEVRALAARRPSAAGARAAGVMRPRRPRRLGARPAPPTPAPCWPAAWPRPRARPDTQADVARCRCLRR